MLLTITTEHKPATDLGYLLHKNPARLHSFELSFGHVHVFYPEVRPELCTAALLLDVDPVGLVRNRRGPSGEGGTLDQYVNDRAYVASSFLSVAIARTLASALGGRSKLAGGSIKDAQAQLGHSKLSTTLEVYTIPLPDHQREAVEKLSDLVTNGDEFAQFGKGLPMPTKQIQ